MKKPGKIVWNERLGPAANARRELPRMMTAFFAHVRQLLAADPPPPELHAIRLAAKHARYTLELFRRCYGPGLKTRLDSLKQLQQTLGEVNDAVASAHLIAKRAPVSPSRRRVDEFLHRRAGAKAAELRREWREAFDAPGREAWWVEYLARNARDPRRTKQG